MSSVFSIRQFNRQIPGVSGIFTKAKPSGGSRERHGVAFHGYALPNGPKLCELMPLIE